MIQYLSAAEAAEALGISLPTLYAYVSRGLIRSEAADDRRRTRRYRAEDIAALKQRQEQRAHPDRVAENALHWGMPVLESALTLIADGRLYYRGRDAMALAREASVEQVAALLWLDRIDADRELFGGGPSDPIPASCRAILPWLSHLSPVEVCQAILPVAGAGDLSGFDLRPATVAQTGARILRLLTAVAARSGGHDGLEDAPSIAAMLQRGWAPGRPEALEPISAALIVCADHELNVSSFTARCVASAGATPYGAVSGGLAALQGVKHGGETERVEALMREAGAPAGVRQALAGRLRRGERIPGFGHRMYPDGDPRAALLLELAGAVCPGSAAVALGGELAAQTKALLGEHTTVDFGLAVLAGALELPTGSALAMFALGRSIGWIGHAIEQYSTDRLIRPRAKYVGEPGSIRSRT